MGSVINASTTAPQGVIYQITDLNNSYYLFKDSTLYPITDKNIIAVNYKNLAIEKHKAKILIASESSFGIDARLWQFLIQTW